ncbi:MAG: FliA/WhiG family RNA polymerase sigma factor [Armatimonadetes bacterium]|nr:FliA/WhiG family RNA polymerase sigma factor [Armatimonadota bacterium]
MFALSLTNPRRQPIHDKMGEEKHGSGRRLTDVSDPTAQQERLLEEYAPLVKHVAGRIAMFLPSHIQMEDLLGDGIIGLLDAFEKFDANRKVQFKTYATLRIRGAILDGLRHLDWVPRTVRRQARVVDTRTAELTQALGRMPSRQEVAESLNMKVTEIDETMSQVSGSHVTSLDDLKRLTNNAEVLLGECVQDKSQDVEVEVQKRERAAILRAALDELSERERQVLYLYHYEGLTCKEVAAVLGVSEPRVSQLHGRGLAKLRTRLADKKEYLVS